MPDVLSGPVSACGDQDGFFTVRVLFDDPLHVVMMAGELDLASRASAIQACVLLGHVDVIVEMADLAFMDCAGYGALVASRTILEGRGGSLALKDPRGEPLRLLSLIEQADKDARTRSRRGPSSLSFVSAGLP